MILGLVFLFSGEYLERREVKVGEFYILVTFATLGAFLMASSLELITIYIGLELMTISSYVLTGMLRNDARSSEASIKFFLMGALDVRRDPLRALAALRPDGIHPSGRDRRGARRLPQREPDHRSRRLHHRRLRL